MAEEIKFEKSEKRLLRIFAFFALVVLVSQILQFVNNRNNESEYRKMIVSSMLIVETSQDIIVETTNVQRTLRSLLDVGNPNDIVVFKDLLQTSFPELQTKIERIDEGMFTSRQLAKKNEMALLNKEYEKTCREFLNVFEHDRTQALDFRNKVVRPAFEKCQQAQTDLINILNEDLQAESDKIASASTWSSVIILLLGISPFILLFSYLLFQSSRILYYEFFS
jgi:hypothetical protein